MNLLIAVLALLSAAFLLYRLSKRHNPEISIQHIAMFDPPKDARPLFAPTEKELRLETEREAARHAAEIRQIVDAEKRESIVEALLDWRSAPDARTTAELLRISAASGLEGEFQKAAREIINKFHGPGIVGLTNNDLAALMDSHIRILSDVERSSGAIFWLKEEVARLRSAVGHVQR